MNKVFFSISNLLCCMLSVCFFLDLSRFCHLPKKGEIVELHSMLLTISPFMFWEDPKSFSESILSLLVLARNGIPRLLMQYLGTLVIYA